MDLTAALLDLCKESKKSIIAIDGPAGAGKTTLASNLSASIPARTLIIHMDDLYNGWERALSSDLSESLISIADAYISQREITYASYDWANSKFSEPISHPSPDLLILEGVGSGQRAIREKLGALIWLEIPVHQGVERVLARDGESFRENIEKWVIQQEQHFTVEDTKKAADFILTT